MWLSNDRFSKQFTYDNYIYNYPQNNEKHHPNIQIPIRLKIVVDVHKNSVTITNERDKFKVGRERISNPTNTQKKT